jgi:hypothetical protein
MTPPTFGMMAFTIMALSIITCKNTTLCINDTEHYVTVLSATMLGVVIVSVVFFIGWMNVVMMNAIMPNVVAPCKHSFSLLTK